MGGGLVASCAPVEGLWLILVSSGGETLHFLSLSRRRVSSPRGLPGWMRGRVEFHGGPTEFHRRVAEDVGRYLRGESESLGPWKTELVAAEPSKRILGELIHVPRGRVTTYGLLARAACSSPRGVGSVMAANPLPLLIPCHRVVRSDGSLGGFGMGLGLKRRLLKLEGVRVHRGRVDPRRIGPPRPD